MVEEDKEKTTFIMHWGTLCYKVMPFELKNSKATYKRAMIILFYDMMHQKVEVYMDDILAKLKKYEDHVQVLRKLFKRLQKFQLRPNPIKCLFRVKTRNCFSVMISSQGIKVDLDEVKAIQDMLVSKTEK
jgi:hypothetical protein